MTCDDQGDRRPLTAVSLFAGVGGFDEALRRAGVTVVAAVEIDPDCRKVLRRHFPDTTLFNDVTEVSGERLRAAGFVPERGIITGGFPCQDLSLAGRRAGLSGARSGLFWHIMRLAAELSPRWLVLENVPGLLSAVCSCPGDGACVGNGRAVRCGRHERIGGRRVFLPAVPHVPPGGACAGGCMPAHGGAMGTVLGELGERGYGFSYRVLDAQFFGVPQQRRRVFIAGCAGDRAAPVEVLLEPEGGDGDLAACPEPGTRVAGTLAASAGGGGLGGCGQSASAITSRLTETASTLQGGGRRGHRVDAEGAAGGHLVPVAPVMPVALLTRQRRNNPDQTWVTHALTAEGADASEDGTGRSTPLVPLAAPLTAGSGEHPAGRRMEDDYNLAAAAGAAVRRLTPVECERLQGFPDGWTAGQSDSARYRQLGNAVCVNVAEWIMRRLVAAEQRTT